MRRFNPFASLPGRNGNIIFHIGRVSMTTENQCGLCGTSSVDLSDEDILAAMKSIEGYIDITPADFAEIYSRAFRHAVERLSRSVKAADIMTREVIAVGPETLLTETARKMADANVAGIPVIDTDRKVVGVISEKDFLWKMGARQNASFMGVIAQCLTNRGCLAIPIRGKAAKDIMSHPAITARAEDSVSDLSRMLSDHHINRVPVTASDGTLVGIVSRSDIVNSFCAKLL